LLLLVLKKDSIESHIEHNKQNQTNEQQKKKGGSYHTTAKETRSDRQLLLKLSSRD
jgi:hypothetical protein